MTRTRTYPIWRYHPEKEPLIVRSLEQDENLGDGWVDSPNDFPKVEETPEVALEPVVKAPAPVVEPPKKAEPVVAPVVAEKPVEKHVLPTSRRGKFRGV
jgi:hypothetical protein